MLTLPHQDILRQFAWSELATINVEPAPDANALPRIKFTLDRYACEENWVNLHLCICPSVHLSLDLSPSLALSLSLSLSLSLPLSFFLSFFFFSFLFFLSSCLLTSPSPHTRPAASSPSKRSCPASARCNSSISSQPTMPSRLQRWRAATRPIQSTSSGTRLSLRSSR